MGGVGWQESHVTDETSTIPFRWRDSSAKVVSSALTTIPWQALQLVEVVCVPPVLVGPASDIGVVWHSPQPTGGPPQAWSGARELGP